MITVVPGRSLVIGVTSATGADAVLQELPDTAHPGDQLSGGQAHRLIGSGRPNRSFRARAGSDDVEAAALRRFTAEYGELVFAPVAIVIAALDEAANLPAVLSELPDQLAGLPVEVLVIDDGSSDETAAVSRRHGARVLRFEENLGHGMALRAGYRLATARGSTMIATLDADGQWDPADLPAMVAMVRDDRADMVVGSRVLGSTHNVETLRNAGVKVFGRLARVLTSTPLTDTSSGLRVMRVEVLSSVRQVQPQYQTSELLLGASISGWRIAEVPTTMRRRISGESKKGHNALYGLRYARVLLGTWLRESCRAPLPGSPRAAATGLKPPTASRLLRFGLTSVFCLLVSELVLVALVAGGWHGWSASLTASAAGVVPGYPIHRRWTFSQAAPGRIGREFVPYVVTSLISAVLAALGTGAVDAYLRHRVSSATRGKIDAIAYLACYGAAWLVRFTVLDRVLFLGPRQAITDPLRSSFPSEPAVASRSVS